MADLSSPDGDPTIRTLLRHVLDTADSHTPRRRQSTQTKRYRSIYQSGRMPSSSGNLFMISPQRRRSQTPYSKRQGSQRKTSTRKHSHGTGSVGRLARVQGHGHLEEQTPRTLLQNILLTAPESSTVMPNPVVKPAQVPEVARPSRRGSSRGSLELQLPELDPPSTLAPGLKAPGKRKQKLRLSVFQQEVNQQLPLPQEQRGAADGSSLASSFNLSFVPSVQPQTVDRPGLARRRPVRRPVNIGAFLQNLENKSLTSALPGDSHRTPVAALPTDVVFEDTQPFSQPLAGCSLSVHHSLPNPSQTEVEDAERVVGPRTPSTGTRPQSQMSRAGFGASPLPFSEPQPQSPELREAVGSKEAEEPKDLEGSSGDEETSGMPASRELSSSAQDLLLAEEPHQLFEPPPSPGVAAVSSESVPAKLPSRTRTAQPRHHQDPYKAGLSHYVKLFSFHTKMPVEKAALEMVEKCLDEYFQRLCNDLEVFAAHAGRKTVKPKDLELLMRRQGLVTDQVSLHVLVERYLPLEYRQQLIPCAFRGNSVFPAQ
uniref:Centromere protein T n=1 Tax=Rattus norvegicus TaxID=10116 RepID=A0ABK0LUZ8_RAT|nr:centromere protein T isoform X4 [Rattus norvegicus]|eukprot:XP_006255556.1 PREDICTED: centromere protein T isoform X1 [Rattus norvegicus]